MNTMTYNGCLAKIEYSAEDKLFIGRLEGISDVVGFHGEALAELKAAFVEAVDDYLETCKILGKKPNLNLK